MERSDYLRFGGLPAAAALDIAGTLSYLEQHGWTGDALRRARDGAESTGGTTFVFNPLIANYCDFCFAELMGAEYDKLIDGRERCMRCTRTAVKSDEDFQVLLAQVHRNMEAIFEIGVQLPTIVRMVNAKEIARRTNEHFEPTPGVDARVLGFVQRTDEGLVLFIENGSPKLAAVATMAHELTHVWQVANWDEEAIKKRYGANAYLVVVEGMAAWAQVQYLLSTKEFDFADRQHAQFLEREDEYGVGYRVYLDRYPLRRDGVLQRSTPFHAPFPF
jgi:hypothetical protein